MAEINRSLITIKPRQPFLDWLHTLDDETDLLTLEEVTDDPSAYLVPEFWEDDDMELTLNAVYKFLFSAELAGWCTDEEAWPKPLTLEMFQQWFDVEFHSMVFDLAEGPIEEVDLEEEDDEDKS